MLSTHSAPASAAAFILAPKAPTTTLTAKGRVKPLNPLHLLNPHARQGVSPSTAHAVPLPLQAGGGKFLGKRGSFRP